MKQLKSTDRIGSLVGQRSNRSSRKGAGKGAGKGEVCPDAEVLAAYVDGGLAAEEAERLEAHLATCADCRTTLVRLSPEVAAPATRWWTDARWLPLAATLVVGVSLWIAWPETTRDAPVTSLARVEDTPRERAVPAPVDRAPAAALPAASLAPSPAGQPAQRVPAEALARAAAARSELAQSSPPQTSPGQPGPAQIRLSPGVADAGGAADARRSEPRPAVAPEKSEAMSRLGSSERRSEKSRESSLAKSDSSAGGREGPAANAPSAAPPPAAAAPAPPPSPAMAEALADAAKTDGATEATARADAERQSSPRDARPGGVGVAMVSARPAGAIVFMEPERRLWWRIVGGSTIESSSDGGLRWNPSHRDRSMRFLAGSAPELGAVWVVGAQGVVMRRAVPLGWARVTGPSSEDLIAVSASSAASARVTTRSGQAYETTDGGLTWTAR